MSFGKTRFGKTSDYELLRFSSKSNTIIIGAASKLFSYFSNMLEPGDKVVSYSDIGFNTGNVYEKLGFQFSHMTSQGYFYTKNYREIYNRMKYQKHKLPKLLKQFDNTLTEWENMKNNGYDRVWNCGNLVYFWQK